MSTADVAAAVRGSSLVEVAWVDPRGAPQVRGCIALLRADEPVLAFTYADEAVAREVAGASQVALSLTEPRSTGAGFQPLLLRGTPRLVEDPTGDLFVAELLVEELRRYPPSRVFADSPMLCREHWWYLPRLVVELDVHTAESIELRTAPLDHLLVVADGSSPVVRVAGINEETTDTLFLDLAGGPPSAGEAVLFGQDASFPDLEQWSQWRYRGTWDGDRLLVGEAPARRGLAPTPGLLQRWRRQRDLERRCRRAIPSP